MCKKMSATQTITRHLGHDRFGTATHLYLQIEDPQFGASFGPVLIDTRIAANALIAPNAK